MCIFCKIINHEIPSYTIYEDETIIAFLDIAQATYGHTLVVPKKHYDTLLDCPEDVLCHMMKVTQMLTKQIMEKTQAKGFNILNNGYEIAGQVIMHAHMHILPRYEEKEGFVIEMHENKDIDLAQVQELLTH
ncbi:MAG: HIT family protein [Erysipelotrichaceae bacterium]|nr:HIT family protein [Erysipelotrichaceae bacterium]